MAITTSKAGIFIDAVYNALLISAVFTDPVRVYDGPAATDSGWTDAVFVGFDGDWKGTFEACLINQMWAYQGNTSTFEDVEVRCAAIAWSGDLTPKPIRDRALILMGGVEKALRTDPTVGMGGDTIAKLNLGTMYQEPFTTLGQACRITFNIAVHLYLPS